MLDLSNASETVFSLHIFKFQIVCLHFPKQVNIFSFRWIAQPRHAVISTSAQDPVNR